ncbi:RNA-binding S4 domain-containing protein [Colwelliaceae bacterium BS250]
MEIEVLAIEIQQEPIELCKLLKIANLVSGGGEAKMVISEGYVYLNGEVEYQKRKKIYFEDIVQFDGEAVMPILAEETPAVEEDNQVSNSDGAFFTPDEQNIDTNQFEKPGKEAARNKSTNKTPNNKSASNKSSAKASTKSNAKSKANKGSKSPKVNPPNKGKAVAEDNSKNKINPRSGRKSISF